jgi:hypothetical protein
MHVVHRQALEQALEQLPPLPLPTLDPSWNGT